MNRITYDIHAHPIPPLSPYTTLFRSLQVQKPARGVALRLRTLVPGQVGRRRRPTTTSEAWLEQITIGTREREPLDKRAKPAPTSFDRQRPLDRRARSGKLVRRKW